ncbi:TetR/AcrR family transcriptional regulator [Propioniferax innocua]|uniref:TetR/AcrR family transcriptional regulator n=1 Tax=Propioniferax innocua TaxID=1753 RepID=UPI0014771433|nr:TetR/AcrR family transcriptional regulator [Propioniferax innocua]
MTNGHELRRRRTREAILKSATRLFDERGFTATTVAEIAADAGVSQRTFFLHFPSKEDLLFTHVDTFREVAVQAAAASSSPSPSARVKHAVAAMIDMATADSTLVRHAADRAQTASLGRLPRSLVAQLSALAIALTESVADATDAPPSKVAPMVGGALGAVQAAGLIAAEEGASSEEMHQRMSYALEHSLVGFAH